uniref:Uncharacterized protein n=1 Tax=Romanomermis culicivorax TaxID=13658 RepID=A0A915HUC0_ROMCU
MSIEKLGLIQKQKMLGVMNPLLSLDGSLGGNVHILLTHQHEIDAKTDLINLQLLKNRTQASKMQHGSVTTLGYIFYMLQPMHRPMPSVTLAGDKFLAIGPSLVTSFNL